jgi:YidC/Oxa1 family membrane protein insertase
VSQLTSTYLMSTTMQSQAQRIMIMVLPIVFLPFILSFPSGLMIYWLTTNLWTTGQGIVTRRLMPKPVAPPKRTSKTPSKDDAAAAQDAVATSSSSSTGTGAPRRVKKKRGGGRSR